jgi:hypothetical protein
MNGVIEVRVNGVIEVRVNGVIEIRVNGVDIEAFVTRREKIIVDILEAIVNRGEVRGRYARG